MKAIKLGRRRNNITCPTCTALPGIPCSTLSGTSHKERLRVRGTWKNCGHPVYLGTNHCELCPSERERAEFEKWFRQEYGEPIGNFAEEAFDVWQAARREERKRTLIECAEFCENAIVPRFDSFDEGKGGNDTLKAAAGAFRVWIEALDKETA